jgi:hypothetical protein
MRQILLPFGADTSNDVPIAAAGHLAARTNASITAMFYPRLPDPVIVDPMSGGVVSYDGLDDEIEAQKSAAEKNIVDRAAKCNPPVGSEHLNVDMTSLSNWRPSWRNMPCARSDDGWQVSRESPLANVI